MNRAALEKNRDSAKQIHDQIDVMLDQVRQEFFQHTEKLHPSLVLEIARLRETKERFATVARDLDWYARNTSHDE